MKERPILFSSPMVRAILAGTKTMTRRILTPQPDFAQVYDWRGERLYDGESRVWCWRGEVYGGVDYFNGAMHSADDWLARCPYGVPGDRLWVKETHALSLCDPMDAENAVATEPEWWDGAVYRADNKPGSWSRDEADSNGKLVSRKPIAPPWRPSIFMPRWASRLTLEVTSVRVERLQDITDEDAAAEGIPCCYCGGRTDGTSEEDCVCFHTKDNARLSFEAGWDTINGKRAPWESNPWVWVVSFKRLPCA